MIRCCSSEFALEFKTDAADGVLFFASESTDFITLYMQNGVLVYTYNCGSGRVGGGGIRSLVPYNDGQWHSVSYERSRDFTVCRKTLHKIFYNNG